MQIPYALEVYERDPVTRMAPAAYKALHPMQTAPVITDDDKVLGESGAIMEYIIMKYGNGRLRVQPESPAFADYLFWFHFANGSLVPGEMGLLMGKDSPMAPFIAARADKAFAMVEARLGVAHYLAGDEFTAADIITGFPLTTMRLFTKRDLSGYPNILAYLARIGQRPAYRAAMAKGDPGLSPKLA